MMMAEVTVRSFRLLFDGREQALSVPGTQLARVHDPLLVRIAARAAESAAGADSQAGRFIVALAGPPGSGKSTLAALWMARASELGLATDFQCLSMDGFHLPNTLLDARTARASDGRPLSLRRLKGVPESYDLAGLGAALTRLRAGDALRWPLYDRTIHEPVPDAAQVIQRGVVIVEGNFLLLDEPGFRDLRRQFDFAVFVECGEELTRDALIGRFTKGGRDKQDALRHVEEVDLPNWRRVMAARMPAEIVLRVGPRRGITVAFEKV
jgi:hypothetical protein